MDLDLDSGVWHEPPCDVAHILPDRDRAGNPEHG
jgi:hypothetical protein